MVLSERIGEGARKGVAGRSERQGGAGKDTDTDQDGGNGNLRRPQKSRGRGRRDEDTLWAGIQAVLWFGFGRRADYLAPRRQKVLPGEGHTKSQDVLERLQEKEDITMNTVRHNSKGTSFRDYMMEELTDPECAYLFILEAIEVNDPEYLKVALGDVVRAYGVSHISEQTGIGRQAIYRMLSEKGNPTHNNLAAILDVLGLELTVRRKKLA